MDMDSQDLQNYDDKCNGIVVREAKDHMKQLCKKYLRFLDTSISWGRINSGYYVSLLLNYWIYDKLRAIYRDTINYEINIGFSALQLIWSTFDKSRSEESYYKKCAPDWKMVDHADWEKRKKLYDYYVDYNDLVSLARNYDKECKYYNKIKQNQTIFDYFDTLCASDPDKCPQIYNDCKSYNPKNNPNIVLHLVAIVLDCHKLHPILKMNRQPLEHLDWEQKLAIQFLVQLQFC
ncbi:CYIR protein [Plasmodium cynomolgi strain B]|uniref:CYIR protein n=1 Tax=Plasmodium cynomolgi (strain B) TaxID=1120755 RepID=K6UF55_PLACD|nr:CYIR protein [Plasmodium cynomolgi strain B]GAB69511.1 CYIR protein [Plasmodium cynomolgi strain B]